MKYSVIVPAFNAQDSLLRCLESIAAAKKGHGVELLVVDDGSSDGTRMIAQSFAQQHAWVSVMSRVNGGEASARNEGLRSANGRYICFVDSDDTIIDRYFDFIDEKLATTGADVVIFGVNRIGLGGERAERPNIRADLNAGDVARIQLQVTRHRNIYWYACARVVSREIIQDLQFAEDVRMGPDVLFNIACLNRAGRVSVFPDCLYNYYENPNSITSARFKPALLESIEAHYRVRTRVHVWPDDADDRQRLLGDFARSYLEHMLPYLLNNLQYLPARDQRVELKRIRDSIVYQECIPNYAGCHPSTTMRLTIRAFMERKLSRTLLILRASRAVGAARRGAWNALGPRKAAMGAAS